MKLMIQASQIIFSSFIWTLLLVVAIYLCILYLKKIIGFGCFWIDNVNSAWCFGNDRRETSEAFAEAFLHGQFARQFTKTRLQ